LLVVDIEMAGKDKIKNGVNRTNWIAANIKTLVGKHEDATQNQH